MIQATAEQGRHTNEINFPNNLARIFKKKPDMNYILEKCNLTNSTIQINATVRSANMFHPAHICDSHQDSSYDYVH